MFTRQSVFIVALVSGSSFDACPGTRSCQLPAVGSRTQQQHVFAALLLNQSEALAWMDCGTKMEGEGHFTCMKHQQKQKHTGQATWLDLLLLPLFSVLFPQTGHVQSAAWSEHKSEVAFVILSIECNHILAGENIAMSSA